MIPMLIVLRVCGPRRISLWLPLFLVCLLLLPVGLARLAFALGALLIVRMDPWRSFAAFWDVLAGTRGTHIEVSTPASSVFIHVY